jgi:hypothetical protein
MKNAPYRGCFGLYLLQAGPEVTVRRAYYFFGQESNATINVISSAISFCGLASVRPPDSDDDNVLEITARGGLIWNRNNLPHPERP